MKGKLAFLLGMALGQCFVWGETPGEGLNPLRQMLEGWKGDLGDWRCVYEKTKDSVEKILKDENYQFSDCDILAIWEFVHNDYRLNEFLGSDTFAKSSELYKPWLKDLSRLAGKVTKALVPSFSKQAEQWNDLLSNYSDLKVLCREKTFKNLKTQISNILYGSIDWGD